MSVEVAVAIGLVVWGGVFVCLLAAQAIEADVERRWDQAWLFEWEKRKGAPVDDLMERLSHQISRWKTACRMLTVYLGIAIAALVALAFLEYRWQILTPVEFRSAMLFGTAIVGLLLLPARVLGEIGLGLVESMLRQVRRSLDERIVVESREEIDEIPRPEKKKGKKAEEPAPAR